MQNKLNIWPMFVCPDPYTLMLWRFQAQTCGEKFSCLCSEKLSLNLNIWGYLFSFRRDLPNPIHCQREISNNYTYKSQCYSDSLSESGYLHNTEFQTHHKSKMQVLSTKVCSKQFSLQKVGFLDTRRHSYCILSVSYLKHKCCVSLNRG